jgi:hypothetical protein
MGDDLRVWAIDVVDDDKDSSWQKTLHRFITGSSNQLAHLCRYSEHICPKLAE